MTESLRLGHASCNNFFTPSSHLAMSLCLIQPPDAWWITEVTRAKPPQWMRRKTSDSEDGSAGSRPAGSCLSLPQPAWLEWNPSLGRGLVGDQTSLRRVTEGSGPAPAAHLCARLTSSIDLLLLKSLWLFACLKLSICWRWLGTRDFSAL